MDLSGNTDSPSIFNDPEVKDYIVNKFQTILGN